MVADKLKRKLGEAEEIKKIRRGWGYRSRIQVIVMNEYGKICIVGKGFTRVIEALNKLHTLELLSVCIVNDFAFCESIIDVFEL